MRFNPLGLNEGATPEAQRRAAVAAFQAGEGELFLISLRAGGAGLNLTGIGLPVPFYDVFNILGGGALGLGLLTVGAGLQVGKIKAHRGLVLFGALLRLLGMPLLMFSGAWLFGIDGLPLVVAVLAGAVPTAASSYVLARQMGGDAPLMANLITVQVLLAIVTLPSMMWLAGAGGL